MMKPNVRFEIQIAQVPVIKAQPHQIRNAKDAYPILQHIANQREEHIVAISLNNEDYVINSRIVAIGANHLGLTWIPTIFRGAICDGADAIIVAHNHPSGTVWPSKLDNKLHGILVKACTLLELEFYDFIIVSGEHLYAYSADKMVM